MRKLNSKGFSAPIILVVVLVLASVAGIGWYVWHKNQINSYDECVKAGYPVDTGTEKVCKTPNKSFVVHNDNYVAPTEETTPSNTDTNTSSTPKKVTCNSSPSSVSGSLVVKEWCVKYTFADADKVTYKLDATYPDSVLNIILKNVNSDCATLGVYLTRSIDKLDQYSGINLGGPIEGNYFGLRGDQAGCQNTPLRDKVAQELETAKVSAL